MSDVRLEIPTSTVSIESGENDDFRITEQGDERLFEDADPELLDQ